MMTFGEKLNQLRTDKGLSQSELARRIGISRSVICNYENGKRSNITAPTLRALANALGVTWQELVLDTEIQETAALKIDGYMSFKTIGGQTSFNNHPVASESEVVFQPSDTPFREHLHHIIDTMDNEEISDISGILGAYAASNENGRKSITQHAWEVKQISDYRLIDDQENR